MSHSFHNLPLSSFRIYFRTILQSTLMSSHLEHFSTELSNACCTSRRSHPLSPDHDNALCKVQTMKLPTAQYSSTFRPSWSWRTAAGAVTTIRPVRQTAAQFSTGAQMLIFSACKNGFRDNASYPTGTGVGGVGDSFTAVKQPAAGSLSFSPWNRHTFIKNCWSYTSNAPHIVTWRNTSCRIIFP